jgi:hypothetical protein
VNGSTLLNAGDSAAFGLPWLLTRERKSDSFLTAKRERKAQKAAHHGGVHIEIAAA